MTPSSRSWLPGDHSAFSKFTVALSAWFTLGSSTARRNQLLVITAQLSSNTAASVPVPHSKRRRHRPGLRGEDTFFLGKLSIQSPSARLTERKGKVGLFSEDAGGRFRLSVPTLSSHSAAC